MIEEYLALVKWYRQGKIEVLGEIPVQMQLFPLQIPHALAWDQNPGLFMPYVSRTTLKRNTTTSTNRNHWFLFWTRICEADIELLFLISTKLSVQTVTAQFNTICNAFLSSISNHYTVRPVNEAILWSRPVVTVGNNSTKTVNYNVHGHYTVSWPHIQGVSRL